MADTGENMISLKVGGSMIRRGDITVVNGEGEVLLKDHEAWLCRCDRPKKMPFCDASHKRCDFKVD